MNQAPGSTIGSGYRTRHFQGLKPPQTKSPSYATAVALLETETPNFIPPTLWPPNSPDLNPVDYRL